MIGPEHEAPRPPAGEGFSDAVTVAFGDPEANLYGVARVGFSGGGEDRAASGLGILFAGGRPVAVRAQGGGAPSGEEWVDAAVAGVTTDVIEPLRKWRSEFRSEDGNDGFALDLVSLSEPAVLEASSAAGRLGGMQGYEQLVAAHGEVTVGGQRRRIDCLGQRGHSWGAPDWNRLEAARTLSVWIAGGRAITLTAVRPADASGQEDEAVGAFLLEPGGDGEQATVVPVPEPRLSTTYDGDGCQRNAGLELYMDEDGPARRAAGEVMCGTTLDLGSLRLDTAFLHCRMEGREGVGRYDIVRRAG